MRPRINRLVTSARADCAGAGAACGVRRCERVDGRACIHADTAPFRQAGPGLSPGMITRLSLSHAFLPADLTAAALRGAQRPRERQARRRPRGAPCLPQSRTPRCRALLRAWGTPRTPSPPAGTTPGRARMGRAPCAPSSIRTRTCAWFTLFVLLFWILSAVCRVCGHQVWWVARSARLTVCARWFYLPGSLAGPKRACQRMPVHYILR